MNDLFKPSRGGLQTLKVKLPPKFLINHSQIVSNIINWLIGPFSFKKLKSPRNESPSPGGFVKHHSPKRINWRIYHLPYRNVNSKQSPYCRFVSPSPQKVRLMNSPSAFKNQCLIYWEGFIFETAQRGFYLKLLGEGLTSETIPRNGFTLKLHWGGIHFETNPVGVSFFFWIL